MIVPMLRLTLLCAAKERLAALNALRALGCVHVALEVRDGEGIRRAAAGVAAAEQALRVLDAAKKGGAFVFKPDAASPVAAMGFDALLAAEPQTIVYISCNPATLARDLALLGEKYTPTLIRPYDMFPRTFHVETMVVLRRNQDKNTLK